MSPESCHPFSGMTFNFLASLAAAALVAALAILDDSALVAQLITTNTQVNRVADVTQARFCARYRKELN